VLAPGNAAHGLRAFAASALRRRDGAGLPRRCSERQIRQIGPRRRGARRGQAAAAGAGRARAQSPICA